jgi:dihydropteroate synthase
MFDPPTPAELAAFSGQLRIYCQPACFFERPHGHDGRVERLAGGMLWFAAWQVAVREPGQRARETLVPVDQFSDWLAALPAHLAEQAAAQRVAVIAPRAALTLGPRTIPLAEPQIMAILNVTPDSMSDGGKHAGVEAMVAAGVDMAAAGAAIIDVGGESTRPGAKLVWEGDEIERVVPVIERLARAGVAVSIDTRKAAVMEAALAAGAAMVNDISGLGYDDRSAAIVAQAGCPVVVMHAPSQSSDPHDLSKLPGGSYTDVLFDVFDWLAAAIARATAAGIAADRIIVDPGIGFGKNVAENMRLINGLPLFHALGAPVLFGASRKRMIGAVDNEADAANRLGGSIALALTAAQAGAQLHRVHDVAETRQAMRIWRASRDAALTRM